MHFSPIKNNKIFGHEEVKKFFLDSFRSGRLHHSWLIHGESGIGKATLVYHFTKFLLQHPLYEPSDLEIITSNSVIKKIEALSHPDLVVIDAEHREGEMRKQASISVEEVREINKFLRLTASESKYRVVVIDGVDFMNVSAANAILKILEEPPKNAVLFLIASSIFKILPTIRSRCISFKLKALGFQNFLKALHLLIPKVNETEAKKLYELTRGNLRLAVNLYESKGITLIEELGATLTNKSLGQVIRFVENIKVDQESWSLIKYLVIKSAMDEIRSAVNNSNIDLEAKLDYLSELQKKFYEGEVFHLEKQHLMLTVLS